MKIEKNWGQNEGWPVPGRSGRAYLHHSIKKVVYKIREIRARTPSWKYIFANRVRPLTGNERRLANFRNIHAGQRCFIIGNGPSLNKLDLTKLKQEITFGVNAIYTNYENMGFYPTYYVVEDVLVAEDRRDEINNYRYSAKFFGNYLRYCLTPDETTTVLNVIVDYRKYRDFPHFSTNALEKVYVGGTVTYLCMQLAFYMGFLKVYLIGFDHRYSIPKNAVRSEDGSAILSMSDDLNHFSKNYFGKGKRWHDPQVDRMEMALRKARQYFEMYGKEIYNATAGGKLEVFERIDYESLF